MRKHLKVPVPHFEVIYLDLATFSKCLDQCSPTGGGLKFRLAGFADNIQFS
jgi:hypothetical protein